MNQEEQANFGVIEIFNNYFDYNFYDEIKIKSLYEKEGDNINKYIDLVQNEDIKLLKNEITIMYRYIDIDELQQNVKNDFIYSYNVFSCLLIDCGKKYLNNNKEFLTESCCVCLENYKDNKKILSCGHSLCIECNKKIEKKCPCCRKKNIISSFDIDEEIKKILKTDLSANDKIKELNILFNYDEFIKNEFTVKTMENYKLLDDRFYILYKNGIIEYKVINGYLIQNKKAKENLLSCASLMVEKITMKILKLSKNTSKNQEEINKLRKQVNFYLTIKS
jgi:hypothetical protein